MNLGFLAYSYFWEVELSRCESYWHPYNFDTGAVKCTEVSFEQVRQLQNNGVVLADRNDPEFP